MKYAFNILIPVVTLFCVESEVFAGTSDRNWRKDFSAVDVAEVLEKVAGLPIATWPFKNDEHGVRHLGPVAQDFDAAFGIGPGDKHIATVDADGVALAAIQELNLKLEKTREENTNLKQELEELKKLVGRMAA